jgi:hypothetical protein
MSDGTQFDAWIDDKSRTVVLRFTNHEDDGSSHGAEIRLTSEEAIAIGKHLLECAKDLSS